MTANRTLHILLVEDDAALAAGLVEALKLENYRIAHAATLAAARCLFAADADDPFGLVVLDLILPDGTGTELLKLVRSDRPGLPVIILSAKSGELDRVIGLELGADDFVPKPFSLRELQARIRAVLRRAGPPMEGTGGDLAFGDLVIRPAAREAALGGVPLKLSYTEFEILLHLARQHDLVVTRETLLDRIWSGDFVEARSVDPHISRLRRKFGPHGARIETVPNVGYKFRSDLP